LSLRRVSSVVMVLVGLLVVAGSCWAVSVKDEIKIGEDSSKEVLKEMPLLKDQKQQDAIGALGRKLVPFVKRKEIPYHFAIVTDKENSINAFALPGGYVFFTERMWRILTPDERAAVMAHEMTHCDLRHGINQSIKEQQRMLWTLPLLVIGGGAGAEAWMFGNMAVNARYSRVAEREADEGGIQLTMKAGFSPAGAVTSMKKLLSIENDTNRYEVSALFADHPDTQKRVDYLTQQAVALGAKPAELELLADDDPSRLGNIFKKVPDLSVLYARSATPLEFGQKVVIKKMLWDEDKQALGPKVIAEATVLTPGRFPTLVLSNYKDYYISDVMVGDGVYPAP
jgi:Zn-dependent protease with chaperone function